MELEGELHDLKLPNEMNGDFHICIVDTFKVVFQGHVNYNK